MRKSLTHSLVLLVAVLGLLMVPTVTAEDPMVRLILFWDEACPSCKIVLKEILPPLEAKYGAQLEVAKLEISWVANYELLLKLEKEYQIPPERRGVPTIFIGDFYLVGEEEIEESLEPLIQHYLAAGGVDYPAEVGASPTSTASENAPAIYMAYFYQTGCRECDRAEHDLRYLQQKYPQVVVESFSVVEQASLAEWLGERYGVPEDRRLTAPAVFVGQDVLLDAQVNAEELLALVEKYAASGAEPTWQGWEQARNRATERIIARFRSFGPLTVLAAGLVDGLNPCAFATLVFFVSYLTLSGRKGREVLAVGAAFTLGVFLAYLVVGLGFYKVLDLLGDLLTTLGRWVYGLTALLCAALAVFSFLDFLKARRGDIGDMTLNLPHGLRMRINAVIRRGRKSQAFVAGAFATGVVVSFLELACTGQVYLPTIVFVMSQPEMRVRALLFLVLYNLLFILPLVVVFILVYYGTGSKQLTRFLQRRAAMVKLGMAMLFAALATWLTVSVVA
ncbi:MAG TPA: hypothetical protein EYP55_04880 [Anaerolineae bacterium]|nr:hypothetical protein [Anaerolineae bacterium]